MSILWKSPSQFKAAMDAKDAEIAELEKKLTARADSDASKTLANTAALFGDAAKEEDFDLTAVVTSVIASNDAAEAELEATNTKLETAQTSLTKAQGELATAKTNLETANTNLKAANTEMDEVATLLGIERAEGTDMMAEVGKLEFVKRETPQKETKKPNEKPTEANDYETQFDLELDAEVKKILG